MTFVSPAHESLSSDNMSKPARRRHMLSPLEEAAAMLMDVGRPIFLAVRGGLRN
jgi:hypothetical protein